MKNAFCQGRMLICNYFNKGKLSGFAKRLAEKRTLIHKLRSEGNFGRQGQAWCAGSFSLPFPPSPPLNLKVSCGLFRS